MRKLFSFRNRWMAFLHDLLWVPAAVLLAFWLRFNLTYIPVSHVDAFQHLIVVSLPVQAITFWYFGLYRGIWRFASLPDLLRILKAVLLGTIISFVIVFIWQRLENMPRTVLVLYPLILILGLAAPRMLYRWLKDHHLNLHRLDSKRALLIGAGQAGELLVRDLQKSGPYEAIGFLDDSNRRQGQEIHGIRVIGHLNDIEHVLKKYDVEVVLLCMPSSAHRVIQNVVDTCQKHAITCRTLPSVADLADGKVEISRLRQVQIEDLLGREIIDNLDDSHIHHLLTDRCILVTGAGGSIGSELCRQVLQHKPAKLLLLDHGEFNLYSIEGELLKRSNNSCILEALLGDIRDIERMSWLFERFKPDIVFNAAAYKHVPLVEQNPAEGVKTNVLGTCQLADLAVEHGVKKFIQISTDKAVNPTNVMGASKRSAEIYCQNLNRRSENTAFITTRFGNVLGSAGSVVPLFRKQIEAGGPVTVTHPDITRYFMTIPEASSLILQAGSMGEGGEIFVLDMGEPVKIVDLAEQMIRLTGLEPGQDIEINFTGLRPGEKLFEELFHDAETLVATSHPKIMLSDSREMNWSDIQQLLEDLRIASGKRDIQLLHHKLQQLVPEFTPMKIDS
ncbi:MAG: nucleoside-diphosphate sugar epimerase/dehydratase [Mariprofundus sp.]|nr:nucleoside-diphosphate sugar epimerase/dehydratase [Mariprofundus sp.]